MKVGWNTLWTAVVVLSTIAVNLLADELPKPLVVRQWTVLPHEVRLSDQRSRVQLLTTGEDADGYQHDLTRDVTFESSDPAIATVDKAGVVRPKTSGAARIRVRGFERLVEVPVVVDDLAKTPPVSFTNEVMPVIGKRGCNSGACHGHNSGKGSFKLSLRGYNLSADHKALLDFADLADPDQSWMLLKPTLQETHRGGKRFDVGSESHLILRQWLAEGAKADVGSAMQLKHIEILPDSRLMSRPGLTQQLVVRAYFADGAVRDITDQAIYELSAEGVIEVSPEGLVTGKREGEAAVFVRFLGQFARSRCVVIQHKPDFVWSEPPTNNVIDQHVQTKLRMIQVRPSELCSDAEFLRRVSFDVLGLPPTVDEVRSFLADSQSDKRARMIDERLDRDEFGEVWAAHWLELSGVDQSGDSAGPKGIWTLSFWLRDTINRNLPYDQFVKALVAAKGSSLENPAITYGVTRLPKVEVVPQLFLGLRLECAQCHDHPFDVWKQSDYNALREFFTAIATKEGPGDPSGREIRVFVPPEKFLLGERDKKVRLRLLDGQLVEVPAHRDRREILAEWLFGPAKQLTARAIVNRVWGKLLGRGIVDPVDDMRFSNPPVNEALLQTLAEDFIAHGYDFKHLVRTILNSRTYQLSSVPNATNERELMNFSHARLRRLPAEQLLDALSRVTGVDESFPVGPPGGRAIQIPMTYTGSRFLTMFGRPQQRMSPCECIRSSETTLPQVLHLLNGDTIGRRLHAEGSTLQRLLAANLNDERLVEELYLTVLSRLPTARERTLGHDTLSDSTDRKEGAEDLMWALLTSQEFLFNH